MKSKNTVVILALMSALILATFNILTVVSQEPVPPIVGYPDGPFDKFGPRVDKLTFKVAGSSAKEADHLEHGLIDVMDWGAPSARVDKWLADPDITMGNYSELSMIYLALNIQRFPLGHGDQLAQGWTVFPDWYRGDHSADRWPSGWGDGAADKMYCDYDHCQICNDTRWFRKGLSYLTNRDAIVSETPGIVTGMETLIMPAITATWENPDAARYPYDPDTAAVCFTNGGFEDYDGDGWLEYSPSHGDISGDYIDVPTLQIYIRSDDPDRKYAGETFCGDLDLAGVPNDRLIVSRSECSKHCWEDMDYDIYIEYWDWGVPLPDLYYEAFHSRKDYTDIYYASYTIQPDGTTTVGDAQPVPWADNSGRYHDKEYDIQADLFKNAPVAGDALASCFEMQRIIHGDAIVIPLYDYVGYQAHSTNYCGPEANYAGLKWEGFCNEPGIGFFGTWTPFNVHPEGFERGTDGKCTLRHGLAVDVENLNILRTWMFYDFCVLDQIYESLIVLDPHNQTNYIPWLCESYNVGTWAGGTATAINFTLIPNILWQDGVPMTAEDVAFSIDYCNETMSVSFYGYTQKMHDTVIYPNTPSLGKETIEIRFHDLSWLATMWASGLVIVPKHIWEGKPETWDPVADDAVIGTGPFRFFKDGVVGRVNRLEGQYVYLDANPNYFRRLVRPDFRGPIAYPPEPDGTVDIRDFGTAMGQSGTFYPYWTEPYGPLADVNKDLMVDSEDLIEIATRFGDKGYTEGYPPYYK